MALPNRSSGAGEGLAKVRSRAPVAPSNRYADPALFPPVLSPGAPTRTLFPSAATESPNSSSAAGVGLVKVCSRAPVAPSYRYADPALLAPASSPGAPTRMFFPSAATDWPMKSLTGGGVGKGAEQGAGAEQGPACQHLALQAALRTWVTRPRQPSTQKHHRSFSWY